MTAARSAVTAVAACTRSGRLAHNVRDRTRAALPLATKNSPSAAQCLRSTAHRISSPAEHPQYSATMTRGRTSNRVVGHRRPAECHRMTITHGGSATVRRIRGAPNTPAPAPLHSLNMFTIVSVASPAIMRESWATRRTQSPRHESRAVDCHGARDQQLQAAAAAAAAATCSVVPLRHFKCRTCALPLFAAAAAAAALCRFYVFTFFRVFRRRCHFRVIERIRFSSRAAFG